MEIRSILVSSVTIYCGLYFLVGDPNEESKIVLFIFIMASNIYFLYYWLTKMFGIGLLMLATKIACLRKYFVK